MFTDGFQRNITSEVVAGIVVVLVLALVIDGLLLALGRAITPWDRIAAAAGRAR
jgi:osmoprotectant transport system permease protein